MRRDLTGLAVFTLIVTFLVVFVGGIIFAEILDQGQKDQRAKQCIAADKQWIDGNCISHN